MAYSQEKNKKKVLIVDDEKIVRDMLRHLLEFLGLEVHEVSDGLRAVELIRDRDIDFDIYFIDVRMPGLDGLDTYHQIHAIRPKAVVAIMSGYAVDDVFEQAKKEGVNYVLFKPFDLDRVQEIVAEL